jgi:hypothetical protein
MAQIILRVTKAFLEAEPKFVIPHLLTAVVRQLGEERYKDLDLTTFRAEMEPSEDDTFVLECSIAGGDLVNVTEAARIAGVTATTIRLWDKAGTLKPAFRTMGKHRRYYRSAIEALRGGGSCGGAVAVKAEG